MTDQRFDTKEFIGVVLLKGYQLFPDGKQYVGVAGKVSVLQDEELVGFKVAGGETANWVLRVDGGESSVTILGCQVRLVHQYDERLPWDLDSAFYQVR